MDEPHAEAGPAAKIQGAGERIGCGQGRIVGGGGASGSGGESKFINLSVKRNEMVK